LKICQDWADTFRSQIVTVFAIRDKDNFIPSYCSVVLSPEGEIVERNNIVVETRNIIAYQKMVMLCEMDVNKLISSIKEKNFTFEHSTEQVILNAGNDCRFYYSPEYHPDYPGLERVPTLQIYANNLQREHQDLALLDSELRVLESPYDGVADLLSSMGIPEKAKNFHDATFDVVLRSPIRYEEHSRIQDKNLKLHLKCSPNIVKNDLRIGLKIAQNNNVIARSSIPHDKVVWRKSGSWLDADVSYSLGEVVAAQVFFSYRDEPLLRWWIVDPDKQLNYRLSIHKGFDKNLEILNKLLFPPKNKSRDFEKGSAQLFALQGFSVLQYGDKDSVQEGPDIIIESPKGNIAVVECTIGTPDIHSKLPKLVQRTNTVKEKLTQASRGNVRVIPVLMTNIYTIELEPFLNTAAEFEVAVVNREMIDEDLNRLELPIDADAHYDKIASLIQKNQKDENPI